MEWEFTIDELDVVARQLLAYWKTPGTIALYGPMGVGKTTLVHALCEAMGVEDTVGSPTYAIINEYGSAAGTIYHIDCYRLRSVAEAIDAGVEDCLYSGQWCFVEWPEKIQELLTPDMRAIKLALTSENRRRLQVISPE